MLSEKARAVFSCAELVADAPLTKIARNSGYKPRTVRYYLNTMLERRVISKVPFLNFTALGFDEYIVYFSLTSEKTKIRALLIEMLRDSQRVKWMFELGGDFQFAIGVMARSPSELSSFMDELADRFGNVFFQKAVAVAVTYTLFGRRYLNRKRAAAQPLVVQEVPNTNSFDEVDHKILHEIARRGFDSLRPVAESTGLPLSTLRYRIRKMENCGLIAGFIYSVERMIPGIHSYRILVFAKGFNVALHGKLYAFCCRSPHVVACLKTLGSWDYELRVEVENNDQMAALLRELYDHFGSEINTLKCEPVLNILKPLRYPVRDFEVVDLQRTPRP